MNSSPISPGGIYHWSLRLPCLVATSPWLVREGGCDPAPPSPFPPAVPCRKPWLCPRTVAWCRAGACVCLPGKSPCGAEPRGSRRNRWAASSGWRQRAAGTGAGLCCWGPRGWLGGDSCVLGSTRKLKLMYGLRNVVRTSGKRGWPLCKLADCKREQDEEQSSSWGWRGCFCMSCPPAAMAAGWGGVCRHRFYICV